jgi:hypothetical protein
MKAQKNNKGQEKRSKQSRISYTVVSFSLLIAFGGIGIVIFSDPILTNRAIAAQVLRGDKIALTLSTETNSPAQKSTNSIAPSISGTNATDYSGGWTALLFAAGITNATPSMVTVNGEIFRLLPYSFLTSFRLDLHDEMTTAQTLGKIPGEVKAYNEKSVALTGYMLPIKVNEGLVTDFLLLPNTLSCCYGTTPRINEIIVVKTTGKGVKAKKDIPISVLGTLHVGAIRNNEHLIGIYQMDCERIVEPSTLIIK